MFSEQKLYEYGGLLAAGYGLYQAHKIHDAELEKARKRHTEAIELAKKQHNTDMKTIKQTYLLQLFNSLEQHFQQLNADLIASSRESERDMFEQRNESFQTIILASSVMFSALSSIIVEGRLPSSSGVVLFFAYSLSCSLSFAFLFMCIVFCIELVIRTSSFMYKRGKSHTKSLMNAINDTKGMMRELRGERKHGLGGSAGHSSTQLDKLSSTNLFLNDAAARHAAATNAINGENSIHSIRRAISKMTPAEIETEFERHEAEIRGYLKKREKLNDAAAITSYSDDITGHKRPFKHFWEESCEVWWHLAILLFYGGSVNMLIALGIFVWAQFLIQYESLVAAIVGVLLLGLLGVIGIVTVLWMRYVDRQLDFQGRQEVHHRPTLSRDFSGTSSFSATSSHSNNQSNFGERHNHGHHNRHHPRHYSHHPSASSGGEGMGGISGNHSSSSTLNELDMLATGPPDPDQADRSGGGAWDARAGSQFPVRSGGIYADAAPPLPHPHRSPHRPPRPAATSARGGDDEVGDGEGEAGMRPSRPRVEVTRTGSGCSPESRSALMRMPSDSTTATVSVTHTTNSTPSTEDRDQQSFTREGGGNGSNSRTPNSHNPAYRPVPNSAASNNSHATSSSAMPRGSLYTHFEDVEAGYSSNTSSNRSEISLDSVETDFTAPVRGPSRSSGGKRTPAPVEHVFQDEPSPRRRFLSSFGSGNGGAGAGTTASGGIRGSSPASTVRRFFRSSSSSDKGSGKSSSKGSGKKQGGGGSGVCGEDSWEQQEPEQERERDPVPLHNRSAYLFPSVLPPTARFTTPTGGARGGGCSSSGGGFAGSTGMDASRRPEGSVDSQNSSTNLSGEGGITF
jgi:hypothetical protein